MSDGWHGHMFAARVLLSVHVRVYQSAVSVFDNRVAGYTGCTQWCLSLETSEIFRHRPDLRWRVSSLSIRSDATHTVPDGVRRTRILSIYYRPATVRLRLHRRRRRDAHSVRQFCDCRLQSEQGSIRALHVSRCRACVRVLVIASYRTDLVLLHGCVSVTRDRRSCCGICSGAASSASSRARADARASSQTSRS